MCNFSMNFETFIRKKKVDVLETKIKIEKPNNNIIGSNTKFKSRWTCSRFYNFCHLYNFDFAILMMMN